MRSKAKLKLTYWDSKLISGFLSIGLLYFAQDAQVAHWMCQCIDVHWMCALYAQNLREIVLISPMRNICARFAQDCTSFPNAQDLHPIYVQDLRKIVLIFPNAQDCTSFPNAQYMGKICARLYLFSPVRNICARFAQDCTYLYFFPQCAIFPQDCTSFSNTQYMRNICTRLYLFLQCAIYAQDSRKIVLLSRNICARLYLFLQCAIYAQDCTSFPNAQYMRKICARLYFSPQCAKIAGIIGRNMSHITYLL